jgi:hypothetical protein
VFVCLIGHASFACPGEAYIAYLNSNPKPFTWTATADEILAKVDLVQANIRNSSRTTRSKINRITEH